MPTYEYACNDCGHNFEIVQSFSDDALTSCPECGGQLRKVFGSVGIVFKGSGFYKTDSRGSSSSSTTSSSSTSETPASSDTSSKSDSTTKAEPASAASSSSSSSSSSD
jgi:putative FmdB family regulatory protein